MGFNSAFKGLSRVWVCGKYWYSSSKGPVMRCCEDCDERIGYVNKIRSISWPAWVSISISVRILFHEVVPSMHFWSIGPSWQIVFHMNWSTVASRLSRTGVLLIYLGQGRLAFFGWGPQPLLWAGWRTARGKIEEWNTNPPKLFCNLYSKYIRNWIGRGLVTHDVGSKCRGWVGVTPRLSKPLWTKYTHNTVYSRI